MQRLFRSTALTVVAALFLVGCGMLTVNGAAADGPAALRRELAEVRRATARYHDIAQAIADGYVDIDVFVPGQGFHYLKPALLDGTVELDKPEILVYAANPTENRLRLVAVEYAVPVNLSADAPAGFTGDQDTWHVNEDFGLWVLHAWVWLGNPNGMFADFNPRVP